MENKQYDYSLKIYQFYKCDNMNYGLVLALYL